MISAAHLAQLIVIAAQLSGYPAPAAHHSPHVQEISAAQMRDAAYDCRENPKEPCHIVGLYLEDGEKILINVEWLASTDNDSKWTEDSFLIHEITHWLQDINKMHLTHCPFAVIGEAEAYHTQNLYEEKYEHRRGDHEVPAETCPGVEIIRLE